MIALGINQELRDVPPRSGQSTFEFGNESPICDSYEFIKVGLKLDRLFLSNMEVEPNVDNEIDSLKLSTTSQTMTSNQCFFREKINWINGFILEFTVQTISDQNEGFAVVL